MRGHVADIAEASLRVNVDSVTQVSVLGIRRWSCTISVCTVLLCYSHSQGDTTKKIESNLAFPLSTSVPWRGCDFSHGRHSGVVVWPHARFISEKEEEEVRDTETQHMDTNLKKKQRDVRKEDKRLDAETNEIGV